MNASRTVPEADAPAPVATRDVSIDIARGLIVALMALDHVRIYLSAAQFDPVDLDATTPVYFAMRWVTHLCAPGFYFLAGLSASILVGRIGRRATARFLAVRGLLLMVLEVLVFGFAWSFEPGWFWFGVIWGLGTAMVAMSVFLWVRRPLLLAAGLLFTLLHDELPGLFAAVAEPMRALLYSGGLAATEIVGSRIVLYPLLPWLALMAIGYASASWLAPEGRLSASRSLGVGFMAVAIFAVARIAGWGEPSNGGFAPADSAARTVMSFLNVEKYPPSLQFSSITVGLVLVFAAALAKSELLRTSLVVRPLHVFGRVPFFFYLLHLFLIHVLALATARAAGWPTDYLFWSGIGPNLTPPAGYGIGPIGIGAVWIFVLALLYPICAAFGRVKRLRGQAWLKYL